MNQLQLITPPSSPSTSTPDFQEAPTSEDGGAFADLIQIATAPSSTDCAAVDQAEPEPASSEQSEKPTLQSIDALVWVLPPLPTPAPPTPVIPEDLEPDATQSPSGPASLPAQTFGTAPIPDLEANPSGKESTEQTAAGSSDAMKIFQALPPAPERPPVAPISPPEPEAKARLAPQPVLPKSKETESKTIAAQPSPAQTDEEATTATPLPAQSVRGTAVAQPDFAVELTQNRDKNASSGQQNLPGNHFFAESGRKTPRLAAASHPYVPAELLANTTPIRLHAKAAAEAAAQLATSQRAERLEKLHAAVSDCTLVLKQSNAQSISVVIKPDSQTQLTLHLRVREGQVEAAAEMQKGDPAAFDGGWKELQTRLERQGIQLSALDAHSTSDFLSGGRHQSHSRHQPLFEESDGSFAELNLKSGKTESMHSQPSRTVAQSCEYWA